MEAEDSPQTIEIKKEADEYWVTVVKVSLIHSFSFSFPFSPSFYGDRRSLRKFVVPKEREGGHTTVNNILLRSLSG